MIDRFPFLSSSNSGVGAVERAGSFRTFSGASAGLAAWLFSPEKHVPKTSSQMKTNVFNTIIQTPFYSWNLRKYKELP
jgi:hypothetical protein